MKFLSIAFIFVLVLALAGEAKASIITLNDLNSTASFNVTSGEGMNSWIVDGANQLKQQWFWFREGTNPEQPINALSAPTVKVTDSNFNPGDDTLNVLYQGQGLKIVVSHTLTGGTAGSGKSDLAETITITNTSGIVKDLHFFQYVDMDLAGTALDSSLILSGVPSPNTATQTEGNYAVGETVNTPRPSHYEAGIASLLLAKLQDNLATDLADAASASQGDLAWAFQWDIQLAPGGTYQISKDKNLAIVPEPGAWTLLSLGAAMGLGLLRLRKRSR
ncbi:MAG: hypothetical protein IT426_13245 [Pirellulales bacterium]|nr:hypothetical protein [Pirellulales bacterium]